MDAIITPSRKALLEVSKSTKYIRTLTDKISTGLKVRWGIDSISGVWMSSFLGHKIGYLGNEARNLLSASSVLQIVDSTLSEIENLLATLKSIALSASSEPGEDLSKTADKVYEEIRTLVRSTRFAGMWVLKGGFGNQILKAEGIAYHDVDISGVNVRGIATVVIKDSPSGLITASLIVNGDVVEEVKRAVEGANIIDFDNIGLRLFLGSDYSPGELLATLTLLGDDFKVSLGGEIIPLRLPSFEPEDLLGEGALFTFSVKSKQEAEKAYDVIESAISYVDEFRAYIGGLIQHLEGGRDKILEDISEIELARAHLRDADVSREFLMMVRAQVMQRSAIAMLAHSRLTSDVMLKMLG